MSKTRPATVTATALAGAAISTVLAATPAAPCPEQYYCFYEHASYKGWHLNYNSTAEGHFNNPPSSSGDRHDELSSVINNGNRTICVHDDRGALPKKLILKVGPYQDYPNLANIPGANDRADSWKVTASC